MRRIPLAIAFVLAAATAQAQPAYVTGTIGADMSRSDRVESNISSSTSTDSDVWSASLRVGTAVAGNWGVELGYVRTGRAHSRLPVGVPFANVDVTPIPVTALPGGSPVPVIGVFQSDARTTHSALDTVAWIRQPIGASVDLVYLGGLAFSRTRTDITTTFPTVLGLFAPSPAFRTTVIQYGTRPLVGAEARIRLTSHVRLVPGLRLQGLAEGWLLRPYAGLGWFF